MIFMVVSKPTSAPISASSRLSNTSSSTVFLPANTLVIFAKKLKKIGPIEIW
jgi:hypothetical protein